MDQWTAVSAALVPVDAALQVVCATVIDECGGRKGVSVKRRDRGGALFLPHVQGDAFPHGLVSATGDRISCSSRAAGL